MSIFFIQSGTEQNSVPNRFIKHSFFVDVCTKFVPYVRVHGRPHGGDVIFYIFDFRRGRRPRRPLCLSLKGEGFTFRAFPPHFNLLFRRFGRGLCYREHILSAKRSESCALPQVCFKASVCVFHCEFRQGNLKLSVICRCRLVVKVC